MIVTEWSDYDEEMQRLAQDIAKDRAEDRTLAQDKAQPVTKDELWARRARATKDEL